MRQSYSEKTNAIMVSLINLQYRGREETFAELINKAKSLKQLSIDIGHEVQQQKNLYEMNFDKSKDFLQIAMSRVESLTTRDNCYILIVLLLVFVMIWFLKT